MSSPPASSGAGSPPGSPPLPEPVASVDSLRSASEDGAPPPPPPPQEAAPFDPLQDILGIDSSGARGAPRAHGGAQAYRGAATVGRSAADRVAGIKGIMAGGGGAPREGFGVQGSNMQMAMHGGQHNPHAWQQQQQQQAMLQQQMYNTAAQQQMYNTAAAQQQMYSTAAAQQQMQMQQQQQQQQNLAAYQTMAYQTMAYQQGMGQGQGQLVAYQGNGQVGGYGNQGMHGMGQMNGMQGMGMVALYTPAPQGNQSVPVMQAERAQPQAGQFRVQKGTKATRVSDSDVAFGPLLDRMKKQVGAKK